MLLTKKNFIFKKIVDLISVWFGKALNYIFLPAINDHKPRQNIKKLFQIWFLFRLKKY